MKAFPETLEIAHNDIERGEDMAIRHLLPLRFGAAM
jgi:hypothetical protein